MIEHKSTEQFSYKMKIFWVVLTCITGTSIPLQCKMLWRSAQLSDSGSVLPAGLHASSCGGRGQNEAGSSTATGSERVSLHTSQQGLKFWCLKLPCNLGGWVEGAGSLVSWGQMFVKNVWTCFCDTPRMLTASTNQIEEHLIIVFTFCIGHMISTFQTRTTDLQVTCPWHSQANGTNNTQLFFDHQRL